MQNTYIVKDKNNQTLVFYYGEEKSVYLQNLDNNFRKKIISNVLDCFTVSTDKNKEIYITCQNYSGEVIICKESENFKSKILFKNENNNNHQTVFKPLFLNSSISFLYNSSVSESKTDYISVKTLIENKGFTKPENIDIFSPFSNNIFNLEKIDENNFVLIYQKRERELQLGYKEISNGKIGNFVPIHKTGYQLVDYSYLVCDEVIHFIYIIKNMFSNQVIYKRKDEAGMSSSVVLYEGQKTKSCNISLIKNRLYCMFTINQSLYYTVSDDFGNIFSSISKYKKMFNENTVKGNFISKLPKEDLVLNEVYINTESPLSIEFLPEFYPEFFNLKSSKNVIENINFANSLFGALEESKPQILNDNFISTLNPEIEPEENTIEPYIENVNKKVKQNPFSLNRKYITTPTENDFMSNFNPKAFEEILKSKTSKNVEISSLNLQPQIKDTKESELENMQILKNKLEMANENISKKDLQILELNTILQNKNKEKTEVETALKNTLKKIKEENIKLKKEINKKIKEENVIENNKEENIIEEGSDIENVKDNYTEINKETEELKKD